MPLIIMFNTFAGSGRFLLWLAKTKPDSRNYLGLEIRRRVWKWTLLINFFSNAVWKLLEITLFLCVCISSCSWSDVQSAGWKTWNSKTCRHVAFASALNDKDKYLLFENLIHYLIWFCRHFMYANASNSFQHLISAYPGPLMLVSILVRALF